MKPVFSVIVPTFDRPQSLRRCLESLAAQTFHADGFEVIVVDDGSTAAYHGLAAAEWPFPLRLRRVERGGPGAARNEGARLARGDILAFTEDDVTVAPEWLECADRHFSRGAIDVADGRTIVAGSGKSVRRMQGPDRAPEFIPCNLFVRQDAFWAVGGYDERFFKPGADLYFREDTDLGFRLLEAGFSVRIADDLVVEHPEQFPDFNSCVRHVRRYAMDPLLYRQHPALYRDLIEVKRVFGATIRRPAHKVALAHLAMSLLAVIGLRRRRRRLAAGALSVSLATSTAFRVRYQGRRALELTDLRQTAQFWTLPFRYLVALFRGSVRHGCFRVLLP